jgi:hypothetical protein
MKAALRDMVRENFWREGENMILILVCLLVCGWNSAVFAQANFYQGKTITIVVGTKAAMFTISIRVCLRNLAEIC